MRIFPENNLKGVVFALLRILITAYVAFGVLLFVRQDNYLFYPPNIHMEECAELPNAEIVAVAGTRAYYLESGSSTKIAVLYHGNAERACDLAHLAQWLMWRGYNVLAVEYAGYAGDSSRQPSVELLLHDVERIDSWVRGKKFSGMLIVGRSIGAGFASYHASLSSPNKLLLVSPFDKLSRVAQAHYPVYPMSLMLKTDLDSVSNASSAKEVLIIHGTEDVVIPFDRGKSLFETLPQKQKTFLPVLGYAHDDVLATSESWSRIDAFLQ